MFCTYAIIPCNCICLEQLQYQKGLAGCIVLLLQMVQLQACVFQWHLP